MITNTRPLTAIDFGNTTYKANNNVNFGKEGFIPHIPAECRICNDDLAANKLNRLERDTFVRREDGYPAVNVGDRIANALGRPFDWLGGRIVDAIDTVRGAYTKMMVDDIERGKVY